MVKKHLRDHCDKRSRETSFIKEQGDRIGYPLAISRPILLGLRKRGKEMIMIYG